MPLLFSVGIGIVKRLQYLDLNRLYYRRCNVSQYRDVTEYFFHSVRYRYSFFVSLVKFSFILVYTNIYCMYTQFFFCFRTYIATFITLYCTCISFSCFCHSGYAWYILSWYVLLYAYRNFFCNSSLWHRASKWEFGSRMPCCALPNTYCRCTSHHMS